ncbi:MAG: sulfurtransferase TusA family protein [Candidatus Hodarchaeota archaeon]
MVKTDLGNDVPEKIDYVADARGSACPGPLLEAKKAIAKVSIGGVLEVQSSDHGTKNDLPNWADFVGHEYLGSVEEAGYIRLFLIRKK